MTNTTADASALAQLLRTTPGLWQGRGSDDHHTAVLDTGYYALNELLPTGGWPLGALVEILVDQWGSGELEMLMPVLAKISEHSPIVFIAPPFIPYGPALAQHGISLEQLIVVDDSVAAEDLWWTAEQMLRHPQCGAVLVWPRRLNAHHIRRLQLAASAVNTIGFLLRCGRVVETPVPLRLGCVRQNDDLKVRLLKSRYGWQQHGAVVIPLSEKR